MFLFRHKTISGKRVEFLFWLKGNEKKMDRPKLLIKIHSALNPPFIYKHQLPVILVVVYQVFVATLLQTV
jgi:hypothetical protein